MQRHKIRLDVVLAGVVLLLLFSLLPFFFQRQIIEEPGTDLRYHHKRPIVDRVEAEEEQEAEEIEEIEERMANIIVEKASEFDETLREYFVKHAGNTVLVYLYGNVQPHTGKSVRSMHHLLLLALLIGAANDSRFLASAHIVVVP